jgi:hypothetical protein
MKKARDTINLNAGDAKALSKRLKTQAWFYQVSDTGAALGYELFDNGKSIEQLETTGGWKTSAFRSTQRSLQAADISDAQAHTHALFTDLDAFDPSLKFMYLVGYAMHKPGDRATFTNTEELFERLDFVAL